MTRRWLRGGRAALGLLLATSVTALSLAYLVSARLDRPAVVALGSGNALSVLIAAGGARLLVPTGDQPTAFGNAWHAWAVVPLTRRVDLLVRPGDGDPVTTAAARTLTVRRMIALPGSESGSAGPPGAIPLDDALRVQVGDAVTVTIERSSDSRENAAAWRLIVERDSVRLAILPTGPAAGRFDWPRPMTAVILLRGPVEDAPARTGALALIVPDRVSGKTLRNEVAVSDGAGFWARRVSPGQAARLQLTPDGLRLPDDTDWYDLTSPHEAALDQASSARRTGGRRRSRFSRGPTRLL